MSHLHRTQLSLDAVHHIARSHSGRLIDIQETKHLYYVHVRTAFSPKFGCICISATIYSLEAAAFIGEATEQFLVPLRSGGKFIPARSSSRSLICASSLQEGRRNVA
jgi:hypothetical protein